MINKLFKKFKKTTAEDLLNELSQHNFSEIKADEIYRNSDIDINWQNEEKDSFLHLCAKKQLTESMKWLIRNGADVNIQNQEGQTPLFYAVEVNSKSVITLLIENKADVDHINKHNRTALQEAVISNSSKVIDTLLMNSKNLDNVDKYGHNLIFDAISNGNKELISKVASTKKVNLNQVDENGKTVLHQKTILKDSDMALKLMESGADPTIKDKEGNNFLFYAATSGLNSEEIIDKAIKLGCDINSINNKKQTILMETLLSFTKLSVEEEQRRNSLLAMIKKLINEGIKIDAVDENNETALFISVRARDLDSTLLLLKENSEIVNVQNNMGNTVLHIASLVGMKNLDLVLVLLNFNANTNIKNYDGKSIIEILIDAVLFVHNEKDIDGKILSSIDEEEQYFLLLKEIIENSNVDLQSLNSNGKPLFFDSILYKNRSLFKLLKNHGIDINQKDKDSRNIIYNYMEYVTTQENITIKEYFDTLQSLIIQGADVNSRDEFGGTVVHKAILDKCERTVKVLLDSKADIKATDKKGRNLVHNCVWKGKVEHFKLIHRYNSGILNKPDKFGVLPINYAAFMGHKDLVIEMIDKGSYVNNPHKKNPKIISFLTKFAKNLDEILSENESELNKKNINMLVENMKEEFSLN